jgi:hypothetical protein
MGRQQVVAALAAVVALAALVASPVAAAEQTSPNAQCFLADDR